MFWVCTFPPALLGADQLQRAAWGGFSSSIGSSSLLPPAADPQHPEAETSSLSRRYPTWSFRFRWLLMESNIHPQHGGTWRFSQGTFNCCGSRRPGKPTLSWTPRPGSQLRAEQVLMRNQVFAWINSPLGLHDHYFECQVHRYKRIGFTSCFPACLCSVHLRTCITILIIASAWYFT